MTVCNTSGKKHYRVALPSSPCDSERCCLKPKMPLHTTLSPPRRPDSQLSKQYLGLHSGRRSLCSKFPLLPNVDDKTDSMSLSPAVPSLKLKPRTRFQGPRTMIKPKVSLPWTTKTKGSSADAHLVTPSFSNLSLSIEDSHRPLREQNEARSNSIIVGQSLLAKNNTSPRTRRVIEQEGLLSKTPPKLLLKPRQQKQLVSPTRTMNKENINRKATKLPFLSPLL